MADWFRSWHGAPTDPKWRTIAKRAKVATSLVVAAAWALMDRASQNEDRGAISGIDLETLADFLDCKPEAVERIITAMREKCVLTDEHFSAWDKRQPLREDGSAERARAWREEQKRKREATIAERERTPENVDLSPQPAASDAERDQTQTNAKKHRLEETRLDLDDDAASRADTRHRADLNRLEHELREAAGLEQSDQPALCDLSPILGLIDAGFGVTDEILPVIRAKRGARIRSWSYFVGMIHEARDARVLAGKARSKSRDGPSQQRPSRGVHSALAGIDSFFETSGQD